MPTYLDRDSFSHRLLAEKLFPGNTSGEFHESAANCLDIALINNMPDAALKATERQFMTLLAAAADGIVVRLSLYALPEVPRTVPGRRHIGSYYSSVESMWDRHLDGIIMTGTEPRASNLADEPYWASMTRVFDWAEHNTHSAIWSCLAAHAAVLHCDGIARRRLSEKRFGVFECTRISNHPLTAGIQSRLVMPHSRWNDLRERDLTACGYSVLTRSEDAGVDAFVKQGKSLSVYFQGHPEYEANSLQLEHSRDVGRYLRREIGTYPPMPHGYFDQDNADALTAVRDRAVCHPREELLSDLQAALAGRNLANPWRPAAARVYGNWLKYLCSQKERRLKEQQGRKESGREKASIPARRFATGD